MRATGLLAGLTAPRCDPRQCAFFLDFDGTLVEIAERPDRVRTDDKLRNLVCDLHLVCGGALALVSGRPIADIDRLFGPVRLPVAGQHGAERRDALGRMDVHRIDARELDALRGVLARWRDSHPELVLEDKGLSLAVHFRQNPELATPMNRLLGEQLRGFGRTLQLQPGKLVLEVKPAGRDKGRAVREFLREPPFAGRCPVFVGDDVTDEHGFAEVNALDGISIKVGPGESAARWRLPDVDAVRDWLRGTIRGRCMP